MMQSCDDRGKGGEGLNANVMMTLFFSTTTLGKPPKKDCILMPLWVYSDDTNLERKKG